MKTFDNSGKLVGEINHFRTTSGDSVTTNTMHSNGRVVSQTVTVAQPNGKVSTTTTIGGKLLP
ncbi:MAG: hypothetical protein ACLPH3_18140 [Terracidiphilus sp.]